MQSSSKFLLYRLNTVFAHRICFQSRKHCGCSFPWQHGSLSIWVSPCSSTSLFPIAGPPYRQVRIFVAFAHVTPLLSSRNINLIPSTLRPPCCANQRLFLWRGVNTPPPSTDLHPLIKHLASIATRVSLCDASSYGAGIRKFHLVCDIFSIVDSNRLPASFELLHSFMLWAVSDPPSSDDLVLSSQLLVLFEPVSINVVKKYLAAM